MRSDDDAGGGLHHRGCLYLRGEASPKYGVNRQDAECNQTDTHNCYDNSNENSTIQGDPPGSIVLLYLYAIAYRCIICTRFEFIYLVKTTVKVPVSNKSPGPL